jgi:hypothetical protein
MKHGFSVRTYLWMRDQAKYTYGIVRVKQNNIVYLYCSHYRKWCFCYRPASCVGRKSRIACTFDAPHQVIGRATMQHKTPYFGRGIPKYLQKLKFHTSPEQRAEQLQHQQCTTYLHRMRFQSRYAVTFSHTNLYGRKRPANKYLMIPAGAGSVAWKRACTWIK